jgi:Cytochrome c oxidase subunit IV
MDSSLHSAQDGRGTVLETAHETEEHGEEMEHAIHLPNPSYWPLFLGISILVAFVGLLFIQSVPWIFLAAIIFVFICIVGWALEDPMAKLKDKFIVVALPPPDPYPYKIGQQVVDKDGQWLGKVQARFSRHILVEQGGFLPRVFYVPSDMVKQTTKNNVLVLSLNEEELRERGFNNIPADLYEEPPEYGVPKTRGVPQFGRKPLSPAETGHYLYGRNWPGINTDASGSYYREEVTPHPQTMVTEAES